MALLTSDQFLDIACKAMDDYEKYGPLVGCSPAPPADLVLFRSDPDEYGRFVISTEHQSFSINDFDAMRLWSGLNRHLGDKGLI